jgi:uncharacterized protein
MKFLPQRAPIDNFGQGGFRFSDHSHLGHLLVLPSGMRAWDGIDYNAIIAEKADIDFFVIGTGASFKRIDQTILAQLEQLGIFPDAMTTSSAIHNYNFMLGEQRRVAAAFIAVP